MKNLELRHALKQAIVTDLKLETVSPEEIEDDAPLFVDGLGLDSLDAVELVVLVEMRFGVSIKSVEEARGAFQSIAVLADFIGARRA